MVPRADIEAVEINTTLGALMNLFEESGHSRMPVYAETLDDPARHGAYPRHRRPHHTHRARQEGRRDQRASRASCPTLNLANVDLAKTIGELSLTSTVLFVPPSMLAADLMARMQATRTQMALVIDEYGGTDGLVSLEDIVEMVVGDIEDEHDDQDEPLITAGRRRRLRGRRQGRDRRGGEGDRRGISRPASMARTVDTIGGMIFNTLGRVPARGEVVHAVPGLRVPCARRRPAPGQARAHRRRRQGRAPPALQPGPRPSTTSSGLRISQFGAIAADC